MVSIEQIGKWCNGRLLTGNATSLIDYLSVDSRKIHKPATALFIPLVTHLRNGHQFIADAYQKGVRNFLISEPFDTAAYQGAAFIEVKDTLNAMQQIVAAYRKQFDMPVIGITGSNGKTVVKEWLYQLLSTRYNMVRSPKSYNSQIGVPLSVWLLNKGHQLAVFEAGISQPGEMERLQRMIQPTIGVFTNIGEAHSEGFLNLRQKINEKLILFRYARQLVYCRDYPQLNECIIQYVHQLKGNDKEAPVELFTWSRKLEASLRITGIEGAAGKSVIKAVYQDREIQAAIPFTDPASVENAIHCWCVLLMLQVPQTEIEHNMLQLHPVSMRLELRQGINDCTVINDSYNSDLTSLNIAINYLGQQRQHLHHTVILSDILQGGRPDAQLYEELATLIDRHSIQRFIGIGPALYRNKAAFRKYKKLRSIFFKSTEDFLKNFHHITFNNEAILLKGARVFAFEKIGLLLEQKIHQTVMSINLSALTHNLNAFRARLSPEVKTMAMVKAFAYGSGTYEVASALQYAGVDYLSVAYTEEGITLRKAGITLPIMVMSPDAISFDRMIAWKLEPEIFNFRSLDIFTGIAQALQIESYPIHVKLDTGMHRLGFVAGEIDALGTALQVNKSVHIASIFSHLAVSEDESQDAFTQRQGGQFIRMSEHLMHYLGYKPLCHLCNSAGIVRHPELHFDMVRLGLGLYGVDNTREIQQELRQISTLKTTIAQIKAVPQGDTVSYGRKAMATQDMRIATICIGYADGYHRALGNGIGHVIIHDKPAKIVGVVCMDMCMVDVTDIPEAAEGDEAIIFNEDLPVTQLAKWAGTIPYEIMTGISQRVKRIYVNEE